jgi:hypothetical protein
VISAIFCEYDSSFVPPCLTRKAQRQREPQRQENTKKDLNRRSQRSRRVAILENHAVPGKNILLGTSLWRRTHTTKKSGASELTADLLREKTMSTILIIVLILLLIGALPTWPYSAGWGYYPTGGLGLLVLIVLILVLLRLI